MSVNIKLAQQQAKESSQWPGLFPVLYAMATSAGVAWLFLRLAQTSIHKDGGESVQTGHDTAPYYVFPAIFNAGISLYYTIDFFIHFKRRWQLGKDKAFFLRFITATGLEIETSNVWLKALMAGAIVASLLLGLGVVDISALLVRLVIDGVAGNALRFLFYLAFVPTYFSSVIDLISTVANAIHNFCRYFAVMFGYKKADDWLVKLAKEKHDVIEKQVIRSVSVYFDRHYRQRAEMMASLFPSDHNYSTSVNNNFLSSEVYLSSCTNFKTYGFLLKSLAFGVAMTGLLVNWLSVSGNIRYSLLQNKTQNTFFKLDNWLGIFGTLIFEATVAYNFSKAVIELLVNLAASIKALSLDFFRYAFEFILRAGVYYLGSYTAEPTQLTIKDDPHLKTKSYLLIVAMWGCIVGNGQSLADVLVGIFSFLAFKSGFSFAQSTVFFGKLDAQVGQSDEREPLLSTESDKLEINRGVLKACAENQLSIHYRTLEQAKSNQELHQYRDSERFSRTHFWIRIGFGLFSQLVAQAAWYVLSGRYHQLIDYENFANLPKAFYKVLPVLGYASATVAVIKLAQSLMHIQAFDERSVGYSRWHAVWHAMLSAVTGMVIGAVVEAVLGAALTIMFGGTAFGILAPALGSLANITATEKASHYLHKSQMFKAIRASESTGGFRDEESAVVTRNCCFGGFGV